MKSAFLLLSLLLPLQSWAAPHSCRLYQDSKNLPHFKADNAGDFLWCFGYLHGRERYWQMEFLRRTALGRKAEIHGYSAVKQDFIMRIMGFEGHAQRIYAEMSATQKATWENYADGVNHGLKEALQKGIWEYQKLGYQPDPWQPYQSIMLLLLQSFDQTNRTFLQESKEYKWAATYEKKAPALTLPDGLPWDTTVLKTGEYETSKTPRSEISEAPTAHAGLSSNALDESLSLGGSNSWVLSKARSLTGNAWLANDPHLLLRDPPFWFWSHGTAPGFDVAGVSLPGVPIIISGTNRKVSWGLTNSYIDVGDVFFVKTTDLGELESSRPTVWFRLWKFSIPIFFKTIERAKEGYPILPLDDLPTGKKAVLRWSGHELKAKDFEALLQVMQADSVREMDTTLAKIGVPSWNYVFADVQGGIGHRVIGRAFKKENVPSYSIQTKTVPEIQATTFLSADEMPHLMNPKRGYVATANNRHWPLNSKFYGGRGYPQGFRAYRIEEMLQKKIGHDFESIRKIQCDTQAVDAQFFVPLLIPFIHKNGLPDWLANDLKEWDQVVTDDCRVCSIYRRWMDRVEEALGLDVGGAYRVFKGSDPTFNETIKTAFQEAMKDLKAKERLQIPLWGKFHRNFFTHLSEDDRVRDGQSIPGPGDEHSVNPGTAKWFDDHYEQKWGASQRMIVEMTSPPIMHSIFPGPLVRNEAQSRGERDLENEQSPWMRWARCERERLEFPVNWAKVKTTEVSEP